MKRKKIWLILISLSILFFACSAQVKNLDFEWREFISKEGNFKVNFPKKPEQTTRTSPLGNGKIQYPKIEVSLPQIYLSVYFSEIEDLRILNQDETKSYYDYLKDQTIKLNNSKLISEQDIIIRGKLAREFIESRNDKLVTYRILLINKMLYQLRTEIDDSAKNDTEVKKISEEFLNSFQIIEK
ncbi:hypothetical protein BH10ACI1_BH10ACI1_29060 [soil metagenome]